MTAMPDESRLLDRAAALVEAAKRAGADAADAIAVRGTSLSVEVRDGAVTETERSESDRLSLRVFAGGRNASVGSNALDEPQVLAERAVAMARVAPEDRYAGLADPARLARTLPALDVVDPDMPSSETLVERAQRAEAAARAVPGVVRSGGASASWSLGGMVLVTSHGFSGSHLRSTHAVSLSAIAGEGTGMQRDYDSAAKTHAVDLPDPAEIGRRAGERAVARLSPARLATGRYTVVFDPRVATSLVGHLAGAANGAAVARKTSFLKDALGTRILPEHVRISDDPLRPRGLGSRPFDGEGVAAEAFDLISGGVLTTWFLDSAAARELGLQTNGRASRGGGGTSPSSTNLTLLAGPLGRAELLSGAEDGIYVTELIGHGVNGVTGDYSRGAAGFRIRGGALAEPVAEITIAGNLKDMYARLLVADDLEYRYAVNAPTVAVEAMTVAGR
ncbi:TldD/PmbA family protein [Prosthecomicrobium pneumaticum]|uniref:PmbA protein n=1 Tax=Prosthecomicrobium pneumaticum TaxID=81895 RepID=A0A7W9FJV1_9HYPH|nr:TldD/PmbA family protein [Prosthecomicrobium pneumaticum]MBB5752112.1 PmbA protein [Prosthecomicrobium pneumaticum]